MDLFDDVLERYYVLKTKTRPLEDRSKQIRNGQTSTSQILVYLLWKPKEPMK